MLRLLFLAASVEAAAKTWLGTNEIVRTAPQGGSYFNWHDGANWNLGTVPASGDSITISAAGKVIVVQTSISVSTLSSNAHIKIADGLFGITTPSTVLGTFELAGGDLDMDVNVGFANLVLSSPLSAVSGTGSATVSTSLNWMAGDFIESGPIVTSGASVNASPLKCDLRVMDTTEWRNTGTVTWNNRNGWMAGSSTFVNKAGATLNVQGTSSFFADTTAPNLATKFINEASADLLVNGAMTLVNMPLSNSGRIVISGTSSLTIKTSAPNVDACIANPCTANAASVTCFDKAGPDNTAVGRFCQCKAGFKGDGDTCDDINACVNNPCSPFASCVDKPAPALDFRSGRTCTCLVGYSGNGETCVDINACTNNPCHPQATCADKNAPALDNKDGRFCTCNAGYQGDGEPTGGTGCTNINACINYGCDPNADCADLDPPAPNSPAGRTCTCKLGYSGTGEPGQCVNQNPCLTNNGGCAAAPAGVCTDKPPPAPGTADNNGRTCTCATGYSGDGLTCTNINACVTAGPNGLCATFATCTDKPPPALGDTTGRTCACNPGYSGVGDSLCTQIDACQTTPCDPKVLISGCVDKPPPAGSDKTGRNCTCPVGYEGDGNRISDGGTGCTDINACVKTPCDANADCLDKLPPALGDATGRTCTCKAGFIGNGEACAKMSITAQSLSAPTPPTGSPIVMVSTTDGNLNPVLNFKFSYVSPKGITVTSIRYRGFKLAPFDQLQSLPCFAWTTGTTTSATGTDVTATCKPGAGVGDNIGFYVYFSFDSNTLVSSPTITSGEANTQASCVASGLCVSAHLNYFKYPAPTIRVKTLTLLGQSKCAFGADPCQVKANDAVSEVLSMEGTNLMANQNLIKVEMYHASGSTTRYRANLIASTSSDTKAVFQTQDIGSGANLHFDLWAGGVKATLAANPTASPTWNSGNPTLPDAYSYPDVPIVNTIESTDGKCTPGAANKFIENCPTEGGNTISLTGEKFDTGAIVTVGGKVCTGLSVSPTAANAGTNAEMTLPSGAGKNQNLILATGFQSAAKPMVSYGNPTITRISSPGCSSIDALNLENCDRDGLDGTGAPYLLTIEGTNFGQDGAQVYISASECTNLQHDPAGGAAAHKTLVCQMPAGSQLLQPMIISIFGGSSSLAATTISYAQCPKGTYEDGSKVCQPCAKGSFNDIEGRRSCSECPVGRVANQEGMFICDLCQAGEYQDETGKLTCKQCLKGSFQQAQGSISCQLCPPGSSSSSDSASSCTLCPEGRFQSGAGKDVCISCALGRFSDFAGRSDCQACPSGKFANDTGFVSCTSCPAGTYRPDGVQADECLECDPGTYSESEGSNNCKDCPAGDVQPSGGSDSCIPCSQGYYQPNPKSLTCLACSGGQFSLTQGQAYCDLCNPGQVRDGLNPSVGCQDCLEGTFQDENGKASCKECPVGKSVDIKGARSCVDCQPGKTQEQTGRSQCLPCFAGFYQDAPGSSTPCKPCLEGKYTTDEAAAVCKDCPPGEYQDKQGQFATACTKCSIGYFAKDAGAVSCVLCAEGRFSVSTGQAACSPCSAGTYRLAGSLEKCQKCPKGRFFLSSDVNLGATYACDACGYGKFVDIEGATTCQLCSRGKFQDEEATLDCKSCEKGTFQASQGSSKCDNCTAGTFAASTNSQECQECAKGYYTDLERQSSCKECSPRTYQDDRGKTGCKTCVPGSFSASGGSSSCIACQAGKYSTQGQSQCAECAKGRYVAASSASDCIDCVKGKYSPAQGASECSNCIAGSFAADAGSSLCVGCSTGKYAEGDGNVQCRPCESGKYANAQGLAQCANCPKGKIQFDTGSQNCTDCPVGTYQGDDGSKDCLDCEMGRYQQQTGETACRVCPRGKFSDEVRSIECQRCNQGRFQNGEGQTSCIDCSPGYSAAADEQTACNECTPGRFALARSVTCELCAPGKFQSEKTSALCQNCLAGKSSDPGADVCFSCPDNTYAPLDGEPSCRPCGKQQEASENRKDCMCPANSYGNYSSQKDSVDGRTYLALTCIDCKDGMSCPKGTLWRTLETLPGWWRPNVDSVDFQRCRLPDHCLGGRTSSCAKNRDQSSPLCGSCSEGYVGFEECTACRPTKTATLYVVVMAVAIIFMICLVYWIVLKIGSSRILELEREQEEKEQFEELRKKKLFGGSGIQSGDGSQTTGLGQSESNMNGDGVNTNSFAEDAGDSKGQSIDVKLAHKKKHHSLNSRRAPSFLFKMKILISFMQISRAIVKQGDVQWPGLFADFMEIFSFVNFDFIPWNSLQCVTNFNYLQKVMIFGCIPIGIAVLLLLGFFLPMFMIDRRDMTDKDLYRKARKTSRQKFWRLVLFTVFMLYPHVCATVLGAYNCIYIGVSYYLVNDMSLYCFDNYYWKYAGPILGFVFLYPIAIPSLYYFQLRKYRKRLNEPGVALQLGFLFEAYHNDNWYFECLDMLHKLAMVSLVSFLPNVMEMEGFMAIAFIYLAILLLLRPYIRKGDDRVHLLTQSYLLLIAMVGKLLGTFREAPLEEIENIFLSYFLIGMVLFLVFTVALISIKNVRKIIQVKVRGRKRRQHLKQLSNPEMNNSFDNSKGIEMGMDGSTDKSFLEAEGSYGEA